MLDVRVDIWPNKQSKNDFFLKKAEMQVYFLQIQY